MYSYLKAITFICILISLSSTTVYADIEAGKAKSASCAACHGAEGKTPIDDSYPIIGGQNISYLKLSLQAYKQGKRQGANAATMSAIVATLSEQDISDLSEYYNSLK
jgi:cytochrome c553